jgi:hypothetical protein
MSVLTENKIYALYETNRSAAADKLKQIPVYCGNEPSFTGLNGWVFEQTIQYCIKKELKAKKIKAEIIEQAKLGSRIKADLKIGNVAIEIKMSGLFSSTDIVKYSKYRKVANATKVTYLFRAGGERYQQYRDGISKALEKENVFFLDTLGEWKRFVNRLLRLLKASSGV